MTNKKSKHTPGPWSADQYERILKSVWPNNTNNKANAALIASAPELLAALENVLSAVAYSEEAAADILDLDEIRAAIAKAKGI